MYLFGIILFWCACTGIACDIALKTFLFMQYPLTLPLSVILLAASALSTKSFKTLLYAVPALLLPLAAFALNGFVV